MEIRLSTRLENVWTLKAAIATREPICAPTSIRIQRISTGKRKTFNCFIASLIVSCAVWTHASVALTNDIQYINTDLNGIS